MQIKNLAPAKFPGGGGVVLTFFGPYIAMRHIVDPHPWQGDITIFMIDIRHGDPSTPPPDIGRRGWWIPKIHMVTQPFRPYIAMQHIVDPHPRWDAIFRAFSGRPDLLLLQLENEIHFPL